MSVVVLNGASSAGKTSLARSLQDLLLPDVWVLLGIDTFVMALPQALDGDPNGWVMHADGSITVGPAWRSERARWLDTIAGLARSGANLLVDEVFIDGSEDQARWREALADLDVTWVGVQCDPDELDRRERARGDRFVGSARSQAATVHVGVHYDVMLDTTSASPATLATRLRDQLGPPAS